MWKKRWRFTLNSESGTLARISHHIVDLAGAVGLGGLSHSGEQSRTVPTMRGGDRVIVVPLLDSTLA